eukprot:tig00000789_g4114.t1
MRLMPTPKSAGWVGIPELQNARDVLQNRLQLVLDEVKTRIPEHAPYRKHVETIYNHRLSIVNKESERAAIEAGIGCGKMELLIDQAEDELTLIPKMAEWKPWEVPEGKKEINITVVE